MTIIVWCLVWGLLCGFIADSRGSSAVGFFFLGLIFGPLAMFAAFARGKRCPHCKKKISSKATVCAYCQSPIVEEVTQ